MFFVIWHLSLELINSFINGFGNIVNILAGDLKVRIYSLEPQKVCCFTHPAHADPARLEEVEMLLLLEEDAHLLSEAGVGEHPNLGGDVAPVPRGVQLLQLLPQACSHRDDS